MSLIRQIAKNTIYQIVGKALGLVFGLATIGLMTRYLGVYGFGLFTTILTFMQFFSVIADFGLQMVSVQLISRPDADEQKVFANIVSFRMVTAAIFLFCGIGLAWLMPYETTVKIGIAIVSISYFFVLLQAVFISLYQKHLHMAETALAEIAGRLVLLVGVLAVVFWRLDLLTLVAFSSLANAVQFFYLFVRSRRFWRPQVSFDKKIWRQIFQLSWPLVITISLSLVYFRADTLIMSFTRPQSEVGIYGATYKVLEVLIQFPYIFLGLMLPLFVKFLSVNHDIFKKIFQKSFDFLCLLIFPMIFSILVLGNPIMILVAGHDFSLSGDLLKVLIIGAAMIYFSTLFGYGIVATNQQKKMIPYYLATAVIGVILYLVFIPIYSYWAAAILTVLTETAMALFSFIIFYRQTKIRLRLGVAGKALLASLVMAAFLLVFYGQNIFLLVAGGLVVYLIAIFSFRGVDKGMIKEMLKLRSSDNL